MTLETIIGYRKSASSRLRRNDPPPGPSVSMLGCCRHRSIGSFCRVFAARLLQRFGEGCPCAPGAFSFSPPRVVAHEKPPSLAGFDGLRSSSARYGHPFSGVAFDRASDQVRCRSACALQNEGRKRRPLTVKTCQRWEFFVRGGLSGLAGGRNFCAVPCRMGGEGCGLPGTSVLPNFGDSREFGRFPRAVPISCYHGCVLRIVSYRMEWRGQCSSACDSTG